MGKRVIGDTGNSKLPSGYRVIGTTADEGSGNIESDGDGIHGSDVAGSESSVDSAVSATVSSSNGSVDPGSLGDGTDTGSSKRRRGRPAGSKNGGTGRNKTSKTTDSLSSLLFSVHLMGSMFIKVPEMALSEEESKQLADAVTRVSELYDMPLMDDKTLAWVNLAMVASSVYGPRAVAVIAIGRTKKRVPQPQRVNGGVVEMPTNQVAFNGIPN